MGTQYVHIIKRIYFFPFIKFLVHGIYNILIPVQKCSIHYVSNLCKQGRIQDLFLYGVQFLVENWTHPMRKQFALGRNIMMASPQGAPFKITLLPSAGGGARLPLWDHVPPPPFIPKSGPNLYCT